MGDLEGNCFKFSSDLSCGYCWFSGGTLYLRVWIIIGEAHRIFIDRKRDLFCVGNFGAMRILISKTVRCSDR